jgi:hypothetical protein
MNDSTKERKTSTVRLYTVPGIAEKLGRKRKAIYEVIKRNGVVASGVINGEREGYTENDVERIAGLIRKPNATTKA